MEEFKKLVESKLKNRKFLEIKHSDFKPSAVLMPFFWEDNEIKIILTIRHKDLKHHRGEISFPGGKQDDDDKNLIDTALRETEEEVGIKRDQIEILGRLDDLFTITKYIITPYVGLVKGNFKVNISDAEVHKVIKVPLHIFGENGCFQEETWEQNKTIYPIYYYYWRRNIIWGATAYIMNEFIEIIYNYQPSKLNIKRTDPSLIKKFFGEK
ncbi:MAG: CoA pyrophosphatase [Candidatus Lokiarchaeota archaeon]|nr:CoA pyrophosphatase [Candidatus Lokiarchaeota archaeon]